MDWLNPDVDIDLFYAKNSKYVVLSRLFFVQAFKIVVDSWKFSRVLLRIVWDGWPSFIISGSNEQLQQQLEYTLLKPDYQSWWISKMQSGREYGKTIYNKIMFETWKKARETYGML